MYDRVRYLVLLCLAAVSLTGSECEKESTTSTNTCDDSKYVYAALTEPVKIGPTIQQNFYFETSETVNKDCHGKFSIIVSYLDPKRALEDSFKPDIDVDFGTNFALGSGFTVTTKRDFVAGAGYKWKFTADQGAKNLKDGQDWRYNIWVETNSTDPKDSIVIESGGIIYVPKIP
jgi:hypothetical protein